ncbi:MAG TPA: NAD-dependent succinate-semialdehyde dehydrogenase [Chthonomonadaceae bacterium]|nr:NAD-dependent succinate-semialdehyde dehydrogenase [Chthonomonadaceae bacterium]
MESPLLPRFAGYIAGQWTTAASGRTLAVHNPATGELLAEVPDMAEAETQAAIEAGARAFAQPPPLEQRREWLRAITALLLEHKEELARIITLEQGKPLAESRTEVEYSAGFYRFCAEQIESIAPKTLAERIRGCEWTVYYRPAGVAGAITPWNFPLAMLAKKLSAAIAAGCSVVAKPADLTPLSAIAFWHLAERAGVTPGILNLVIGRPAPIGKLLCEHPAVRVLSFTGSTAVGKLLLQQTAPYVKRLALELGGNAPYIVFEDADIEAAVTALMANKFRCAGQTCVCTNRVYAHEAILPRFVEAVGARIAALKVGNGLDEGVEIGPLINRAAFEKVNRHVTDALNRGAQRVVGQTPEPPRKEWGCFYPPTLLTAMRQEMLAFQEETFGPVVSVASFHSEDEVLALANGTPYGLASYLFTRDEARAARCAERLQFGHVGINTGTGPTPEAPFGGMKQSGIGREGGLEGMLEFCEPQAVAKA